MNTETFTPWSTLVGWISKNPNASKKLSLPVQTVLDEVPQESEIWTTIPVLPATPFSCILSLQDHSYLSHPEQSRASCLRDECTRLQEQATLTLRGRQWPVRKTAEGLAEVCLETRGEYSSLGLHALAVLRECQLVIIQEQKKSIRFVPEDVRAWSSEIDVLFIQEDMRGAYLPPKSFSNKNLSKWLSDKEADGWTIQWPLADQALGLEDVKKILIDHNESVTMKQNKEALRKRAGRAQSVRILAQWEA